MMGTFGTQRFSSPHEGEVAARRSMGGQPQAVAERGAVSAAPNHPHPGLPPSRGKEMPVANDRSKNWQALERTCHGPR